MTIYNALFDSLLMQPLDMDELHSQRTCDTAETIKLQGNNFSQHSQRSIGLLIPSSDGDGGGSSSKYYYYLLSFTYIKFSAL